MSRHSSPSASDGGQAPSARRFRGPRLRASAYAPTSRTSSTRLLRGDFPRCVLRGSPSRLDRSGARRETTTRGTARHAPLEPRGLPERDPPPLGYFVIASAAKQSPNPSRRPTFTGIEPERSLRDRSARADAQERLGRAALVHRVVRLSDVVQGGFEIKHASRADSPVQHVRKQLGDVSPNRRDTSP